MKARLFLGLLILPLTSLAQQRSTHNLFWVRLSLSDTITEKLEWEFSFQQRSQNNYSGDPNIFHSFQFKSYGFSLQYALSKKLSISALPLGYYESHMLNILPSDREKPSTKEWRSNIGFIYEVNTRHFIFLSRISLDYRRRDFPNDSHYKKNWRVRYMIRFDKEVRGIFSDVKPVTFTLFDEVFLQFGDAVKNNATIFDQHRLYTGASYEIVKNTTFSIGYAYGFQIRPSGDQYDDINSYCVALTFEKFTNQFVRPKSKIKRNA